MISYGFSKVIAMNRRQFFNSILRTTAGVGIVSLGAYVLLKNNGNNKACETFNACTNCSSVKKCDKQQAIKFRNDEARK